MSIIGACIVPHPPLIVPSVGRGEEEKIQGTIDAYDKTARTIADLAPQTIIVITPHSTMYKDYIHISPGPSARGSLERFNAPNVRFDIRYDQELAHEIAAAAAHEGIAAGESGERDSYAASLTGSRAASLTGSRAASLDHGTMVPLYFINQYIDNTEFIRLSISGLSLEEHYRFGMCIQEAVKKTGRKTYIVASGDLSHRLKSDGPYGYSHQGPEFDKKITEAMADGDFNAFLDFDEEFCDNAGECGLRSFVVMAGALDNTDFDTEFLSYEGPFGVGYAVCGYRIKADPYVALARSTLEHYIKTRRLSPVPNGIPSEMLNKRAGVFVSIKKYGRLRGCIGTIGPVQKNIAEEIISNAVSSGTRDPRFSPVTEQELDDLIYSVDILSPPEPILDRTQLDVNRYGVIVTSGYRRGLLLPMLEGVDTVDEQISIALEKAGIDPHESYELERFEVVRHI